MHDLSDQQMAEQLCCTVEALAHLKLCMLPRRDYFQEDVERIAAHAHADAIALAQVLNSSTTEP